MKLHKVYTKIQCIVKALEENDVIEGSGLFGIPATEEQAEARKDRLHRQRHAGNFAKEEEPFTDEELFSLWYDLASCLLEGQKEEINKKNKSESLLHQGTISAMEIIEKEIKKSGLGRTATPNYQQQQENLPRTPNSNTN